MFNVETHELEGHAATRYALAAGAELIVVPAYLAPSEAAAPLPLPRAIGRVSCRLRLRDRLHDVER